MAHSTGLHLRFALATAAVIAAVGGGLLWYVQHSEVGQAEQTVTAKAQYVEKSILRDELKPTDLTGRVTGAERKRLDWLFEKRVLMDGLLRVKLYSPPNGIVTYSNVHSLIGTRTDDVAEFRRVLAGNVVHDVEYINHEGGTGKDVKALEVYVPLQLRASSRPAGVFEVYQSYGPVASTVRSFIVPFGALLLLALLLMWAALFPLIRSMVRSLASDRAARHTAEQALEDTAEQLRQSQKMDAVGRVAGGVAHDFNNLLLAINGYAEFLTDSLVGERERHYAQEIRSAGARAAELTHQLLAFSRRQVLSPRVVNLNDSVREMDGIIRRVIGEGIRVVLHLDERLHDVEADPSQLGQVLLNLAVNARDAMSGKGTLRITTRNDGAQVHLDVADTGVGMDSETQVRIFEPFFTTKDVGQGTGLGLATVYGIVTQSGGTISVRSTPGQGTVFTVSLPATLRAREQDSAVDDEPQRGAERILVVDDEKVVRELLAQMLRAQGYDVSVAASAREARAFGGPWDVLVTDVVMPGTDGVSLARQIDARHVLFISGYDQEALVESNAMFLQKPFGKTDLADSVRSLLDGDLQVA